MAKIKFTKGGTIHKTKRTANKIIKSAKEIGVRTRLVKLKKGYRVDKSF